MDKKKEIEFILNKLITEGNIEVIDTHFSPNYVAHAGGKLHEGHAFLRRFSKQLQTALPDMKLLGIQVLCENENRITWIRKYQGTHSKNLQGIPPSLKKVKWEEMVVTRFEGKLIVEEWLVSDLAAQLLFKLKPKK